MGWRTLQGPADAWISPVSGGTAIAEFPRAGTYTLEVSMTLASGQILRSQHAITTSLPSQLETRLESEFPARSIQSGFIGPRLLTENGDIYLAYIDPSLRTMVAKRPLGVADGRWQGSVILENTPEEENHRKPALGIDRDGFIHVVYNMHNSPWTYKVSKRPRDISEWNDLSADPSTGIAEAVPGQAITYPFLARSPSGDLWMTFRECTACSESDFFRRGWSAGLLKYDPATGKWQRPGGRLFAQGEAYRPQYLRVWFDFSGTMHLGWVWGLQYTRAEGSDPYFLDPNYPSYLKSTDGGATFLFASNQTATLPLTFASSDRIISPAVIDAGLSRRAGGYFGQVDDIWSDPAGNPVVTSRFHAIRHSATNGWSGQWDSGNQVPFSGAIYRYTINGDLIAVSAVSNGRRGITVHRSRDNGATWTRFEVDASATDNALSNPVYFLDEEHYLRTGGQALRVALAYTRTTQLQPVIRVFTVFLPG